MDGSEFRCRRKEFRNEIFLSVSIPGSAAAAAEEEGWIDERKGRCSCVESLERNAEMECCVLSRIGREECDDDPLFLGILFRDTERRRIEFQTIDLLSIDG